MDGNAFIEILMLSTRNQENPYKVGKDIYSTKPSPFLLMLHKTTMKNVNLVFIMLALTARPHRINGIGELDYWTAP